jgi:hypothetical protein
MAGAFDTDAEMAGDVPTEKGTGAERRYLGAMVTVPAVLSMVTVN